MKAFPFSALINLGRLRNRRGAEWLTWATKKRAPPTDTPTHHLLFDWQVIFRECSERRTDHGRMSVRISLQLDDRWKMLSPVRKQQFLHGDQCDCWFNMSGRWCRVTSGPYRCARRPAGGSLGSARRSTSGTCTHTWWSGWPATCRSLDRSTSPHSRRRRETSCCRPAPQFPSTLRWERERQREGQWGFKVKVFHMICFAFIRIYL